MSDVTTRIAARTGAQYLEGLRSRRRELWLNGELVSDPLEHPLLAPAAHTLAEVYYDLQHEHPEDLLAPDPDSGQLVGVSHLIPRTRDDLERRRRACEIVAAATAGMMGRTPDYLNVTFACFAGRADVWARRGNERGAENLLRYYRYIKENDLCLTHALINPPVDRSKPEAEQGGGEVSLHKVGETADAIVVRGARMLATLAPYADEIAIYPGSDLRPGDTKYALSFAIPVDTPGLRFICRDSFTKLRDPFDYPLSSRFDEMDAVVIFDDVEVPKDRVFLDGDTIGYTEVITETGWRSHIMHQAFTRAYVKLSFVFGLAHLIANATGVIRFDHIQEKLGEIWTMVELTRSAVLAAEAGATVDEGGVMCPDQRPFVALRAVLPKWMARANELLQLIGGGGFMLTPSKADLRGPRADDIAKYLQAANSSAEERIRLFRLAWDFVGSDLGGRSELYERFYLSDPWRMTVLAYQIADKEWPVRLVESILGKGN